MIRIGKKNGAGHLFASRPFIAVLIVSFSFPAGWAKASPESGSQRARWLMKPHATCCSAVDTIGYEIQTILKTLCIFLGTLLAYSLRIL